MSMARKIRCVVAGVANHGGGVYTIDLTPAIPPPLFRPGQFLHLTVDEYDPASFWPESRVFSIASSPHQRCQIRVCYSVKGRYTTRMEQALRPGREVWIKLPFGEFVIDENTDAVLLAGGTGISAFSAFIEALKPTHPHAVWLVYGARNPQLLLFRDLILAQLEAVPTFNLLLFVEHGQAELAQSLASVPRRPESLPGRISLDLVWRRIPAPESRVYYLSGPPVMINTLSEGLRQRAVTPDQIRTDAWD